MVPLTANRRVISDRLDIAQESVDIIRSLPLGTSDDFVHNRIHTGAVESYIRRSLEALLDIGRHILVKAYAKSATEYKDIPRRLKEYSVIDAAEFQILYTMAGYRNRLVHFYHEVTSAELYTICTTQLGDIELIASAYRRWMQANPQLVSDEL